MKNRRQYKDYHRERNGVEEKHCRNCNTWKTMGQFHKNKNSKDGRVWRCEKCRSLRVEKKVQFRHSRKRRNKHLLSKYGISIKEYDVLLADQSGCCAICGVHYTETASALAIDHDHKTGQVRGLLCLQCNLGIGGLQDNIDLLASAASYLINATE